MAKKQQAEAKQEFSHLLSELAPARGSRRRRKRVGFGEGSGLGKTCGKGGKGQTVRAGGRVPRGFEGGQMPLHRRLPKIGFTSRKKVTGESLFQVVSLERLVAALPNEGEITLEKMLSNGIVRKRSERVKVLGGKDVAAKVIVEAHAFSQSAKEAIERAGGEARLV